jgi:hypothetical protein
MEFNSVAIEMHAASRITLPMLDNTIYSMLINSPIALINTFARPTFFDATSVLSFLASLENLGIYLLVLLAIISPIKPTENQKQFIEINAELARLWKPLTKSKSSMLDAEKWAGVVDKLQYLKRD